MKICDDFGNIIENDSLVPLVIEDGLVHFFLRRETDDTLLRFEIWQVGSWANDNGTEIYDVPHDVELYISGVIKSDGCSHVYFGEMSGEPFGVTGYLHLCGKRDWTMHAQVMRQVYEYAKKTIVGFNDLDDSVCS